MPARLTALSPYDEPGRAPALTDEVTYLNLNFNNGFSDKDFDRENPEYKTK